MESDLQVVHLSAGAKVVTCFWPSQATSYLMERSPTKRAADPPLALGGCANLMSWRAANASRCAKT